MAWAPDIELLRARDDAEWASVEERFGGRLLAYALRRTGGDHQAAEDVLQETFLGAVRGIGGFDPRYTFEQYLFGIVRNRSIDFMRRRKLRTLLGDDERDDFPDLDVFVDEADTPSAIVRGEELSDRAVDLFVEILRDWVRESREQGEWLRLIVLEALFAGGWRNRDVWHHLDLRDETAVAGIKFRAIRRLQQLAAVRESGSDLLRFLAAAEDGKGRMLDLDVASLWTEHGVSCHPRATLAALWKGSLDEGARRSAAFHLRELGCEACRANLDDIAGDPGAVDGFLDRLPREPGDLTAGQG